MPTCSADDVFPWNSGRFLARMFLVDDPLAVPDDYLIFTATDVQKLNLSFWGVIVAIVPHGTFLHTGRNSCEAAAVAASNTVVARQRIRVVKGCEAASGRGHAPPRAGSCALSDHDLAQPGA